MAKSLKNTQGEFAMNERTLNQLKVAAVLAGSLAVGACGGGDSPATSSAAPEVVVSMVREVRNGVFNGLIPILDDAASTVIVAVVNAGINVRAIRCASLGGSPGLIRTYP
jgi:hypothetical protein